MKPLIGVFSIGLVIACSGWSQEQRKPSLLVVEQAKNYPVYHLDSADVSADPLRGLGLAVEKNGQDWPLTIALIVGYPSILSGTLEHWRGKRDS
jgi:hypothetical protein